MNELETKQRIERALSSFSQGSLRENGLTLLNALGYRSERQVALEPNTFAGLVEIHPPLAGLNPQKALVDAWLSVDVLFQLTGDDIRDMSQGHFIFETVRRVDNQIIESYLFLAVHLSQSEYSRSQLAAVTREINRFFAMPVMILFRYGACLTLSLINRRLNKREENKDVLEKVTLIKGIHTLQPLRAHIEILFDLSLDQLQQAARFQNFVELHHAWQKTLDTSELNKKFYREIADWYFWAVKNVQFPPGAGADADTRNATSVIRLITRLIFVWFIKEKGLVPEDLFDLRRLRDVLNFNDPQSSAYYKAILQNLFFATLNTEMGKDRRFRGKNKTPGMLDSHHGISTVYRYETYFKNPSAALALFAGIPFLNGGLFECLDKREEKLLVDGFSDDPRNQPVVPDELFFSSERSVDLTDIYGDARHSRERVRGLIHIFNSYKFTIEENTPLEEEIALDPELLGKVFENLLAAYNPETGTTARKQTGSFYTPREIVNYMVDEALIAYLETKLTEADPVAPDPQPRLSHLLAYNQEPHQFNEDEEQRLISAIDAIKVLDPACGSGAFPMGVLHKLVFLLGKLDPGNQHWQRRQLDKAAEIPDPSVRERVIADIEQSFAENELDYGRKLYLIENCIYGVDIQPIAVQIAKLRFFISLVVDQKTDPSKPNLGVRPLPNLETKFVAANSLIGIERPRQMLFQNPVIDIKEKELADVRNALFTARTPVTKRKYREIDRLLRVEIAHLLRTDGWGNFAATELSGWDPYGQNTSASFFDPVWMFGIINGFDVVIGNPPYITVRSQDDLIKKIIREKYIFAKGADIYVAFIEKSLKLLKKNGVLSVIVPNKFFGADYGILLRKHLQFGGVEISHIWDLKDEKIFENAQISTIVIIIRNQKTDKNPLLKRGEITIEFPNLFDDDGKIQIETNEQGKSLVQKMNLHPKLSTLSEIRTGIMGFEYWKMEPIVVDDEPQEGFVKLLTNGNFSRYTNSWGVETVDLYKNKYFKPSIKLDEKLINRNTIELFKTKPKIIVRGVSRRLAAIVDKDGSGLLVAVHSIVPRSVNWQYILGLLNSKLLNWYHLNTQYSIRIPQGSLKYPISFYKQLPIPLPNSKNRPLVSRLTDLVDSRVSILNSAFDARIQKIDVEIDQLVYELYGLSKDEIAIVEGNE